MGFFDLCQGRRDSCTTHLWALTERTESYTFSAPMYAGMPDTCSMQVVDTEKYDVVCVSPRNHFVYTPMLPSSAIGETAIQLHCLDPWDKSCQRLLRESKDKAIYWQCKLCVRGCRHCGVPLVAGTHQDLQPLCHVSTLPMPKRAAAHVSSSNH